MRLSNEIFKVTGNRLVDALRMAIFWIPGGETHRS